MANLLDLAQNFSTTLNVAGGIDAVQTTGIVLTSVVNLPSAGILCFDWSSPLDISKAEYIEYSGFNGNELTGVIRGAEGISAKQHANGCTVVAVVSKSHINRLNAAFKAEHAQDGTHDSTKVAMLAGSQTFTGDKVFSGAVTISGAITSKKAVQTWVTATDGATVTFDLSQGNLHQVTLGGNRTLAVSNVSVGQCFIVRLKQDGTGSRTVTWWSGISWAGGSAPTLTTTANKADVFGFVCTGTNTYDGFIVGQNV